MPFWRLLLTTLGWIVLSGILLISGFSLYYFKNSRLSEAQAKVWLGDTLQLVEGKGTQEEGVLKVQSLSPGGQAIVSSGEIALAAEKYPILEYQLQGLHADMDPVFFWRRAAKPDKVVALPLRWNAKGNPLVQLVHHSAWQGTIIELGIGFHKNLSEPVLIKQLTLKPLSIATLWAVLWSDWTTFQGWSQRSINFVDSGSEEALIPLVSGVVVWVGLALILYAIGKFFQRQYWNWRVVGMAFLLGWVAIDIHWQARLWHQLQATYERYGGKGWQAKHLAAEDGALFKFIAEIKAHLLPMPQRIFLVAAKSLPEGDYTRLRACYHLLPYNVYDYGVGLPDKSYVRTGDYVLILGILPKLTFNTDKQLLQWNQRRLAAKEIYTASMGTLYRLL